MFDRIPTVEERLRLVLAYLTVMSRIARLVNEPVAEGWQPLVDPSHFPQWVAHMGDLTAAQASSALAVLPATAATLEAPFVEGVR